jgi:hypothetical protein
MTMQDPWFHEYLSTIRGLAGFRKIPRSENRSFTLNGWNPVNAAILNAVSESGSVAIHWNGSS